MTLPAYTGAQSFAKGDIHKLITISTPHQGTPLASDLIAGNLCTAEFLAGQGLFGFSTATLLGATVTGGVGDLQARWYWDRSY